MLNRDRRRPATGLGLSVLFGVAAIGLTGCGGTHTGNTGGNLRSTIVTTDVAYGLNASQLELGGTSTEISGLESADESTFYLTGATASTAVPISAIQGTSGSIPLGFPLGAAFQNTAVGQAATPGLSVRFRVSLSNGSDANGKTYAITGATLTSPDLTGQTIPFTFSPNTASTYGLANATYVTAPFNLPATMTTGLHTFVVSVTDSKPETTTTTYSVVVLNGTDAAVLVATTAGSTVSITNPVAGTVNPATADEQGEAVLFAAPGTQTISSLGSTENATLTAGTLTIDDSTALTAPVATGG